MLVNFKDFLDNLIIEELHPELRSIVTSSSSGYAPKQTLLAKKIKQLTSSGQRTGIEGNMPKGSSRAYLKHDVPHHIVLDGKDAHIPSGTKVAIRAALDKHHDKSKHEGMALGVLQNHAEGSDHFINGHYRMLTHEPETGSNHYSSNKESGIFPPLLDHDHEHHEWTHVGHARDIKPGEFKKLTKTASHPGGISHKDFVDSLNRFHNRNNGRHWDALKPGPNATKAEHASYAREKHLDHIDNHPLIQKFQDYHGNTGHPTGDYAQKKNMGVWEHPDGSHHIVARDHGFNSDVASAYEAAHKKEWERHRR